MLPSPVGLNQIDFFFLPIYICQNHFSISIKYQLRKKIDDINLDFTLRLFILAIKKLSKTDFFNV
jgi:hypothetical protein